MKVYAFIAAALLSANTFAKTPQKTLQISETGDYIIKFAKEAQATTLTNLSARLPEGTRFKDLDLEGWVHVQLPQNQANMFAMNTILSQPGVLVVQPNYKIHLLEDYRIKDKQKLAEIMENLHTFMPAQPPPDNPAIPTNTIGGSGPDPLFSSQWGMNQMGVKSGWAVTKGDADMIVAVIDTGVDYTHEDLQDNIWRNPGEIAGNGIDDDRNGYIDDLIGWDFAGKDNKPYDFSSSIIDILTSGGNPGHGTHCAGNVAARSDNGKGIAGVAPGVKIMPLRFITEKGQGTTADAIAAVKYAVDMGAKITSNSWGSEGEDPGDATGNQALRDVIKYSEQKGTLFIAAAGNGHQGAGYNNDTDSNPAYPASYDNENIVSVAAIDEAGSLGSFSNWGARTVDLGAPGLKVFSTMVGNEYNDKVIDFGGFTANWDGTSMAAPHVSGAAALYWSAHPGASWLEVKKAILGSVKKTSTMNGKSTSGGQLDVMNLMK